MLEWPFVSHIDAYIKQQAALRVPQQMLLEIRVQKLAARDVTRQERGLPKIHEAEVAELTQQLIAMGARVTGKAPHIPTASDRSLPCVQRNAVVMPTAWKRFVMLCLPVAMLPLLQPCWRRRGEGR